MYVLATCRANSRIVDRSTRGPSPSLLVTSVYHHTVSVHSKERRIFLRHFDSEHIQISCSRGTPKGKTATMAKKLANKCPVVSLLSTRRSHAHRLSVLGFSFHQIIIIQQTWFIFVSKLVVSHKILVRVISVLQPLLSFHPTLVLDDLVWEQTSASCQAVIPFPWLLKDSLPSWVAWRTGLLAGKSFPMSLNPCWFSLLASISFKLYLSIGPCCWSTKHFQLQRQKLLVVWQVEPFSAGDR